MANGVAGEAYPGSPSVPAKAAAGMVRLDPKSRWKVTQATADLLTVFLAAMANYALYLSSGVGQGHYEPVVYFKLNLVFASITVFALHGYGAYRDELGLLRIEAVRKILRAVFAGVLLTLGLSFLVKYFSISRATLLMLGPTTILALVAQRVFVWRIKDKGRATSTGVTKVIIYGAGETGRLIAKQLLDEQQLELLPVGFLDDNPVLTGERIRVGPGVAGKRIPVLGGEAEIPDAFAGTGARAVVIAMPSAPSQRISDVISKLESHGIPFFFVPSAGDLLLSSLRLGRVAGIPVFTKRSAEATRLYLVTKRVIDVIGSSLLIALFSPLLALGAALVRISSPGPVLFTQSRIGLKGRTFKIYKLRTMYRNAPRYALHPTTDKDARVTAVGYWLRRLSIDELPQLFNVLKGDMSLVGPRPEMPFVAARYTETQRQRLNVTPGLTGLWQISADRAFSIHDNLHYDLYYVEHRSASMDLAILLMTPFVLLAKDRAM